MSAILDELVANFHRWERRGRGAELFPAAVRLEPPFAPFPGHRANFPADARDAGAQPTALSRLADKIFRALQPPGSAMAPRGAILPPPDDGEPDFLEGETPLAEFRLLLPPDMSYPLKDAAHFFTSLSHLDGPLAFEITATPDEFTVQIAACESDAEIVDAQIRGHFPAIIAQPVDGFLADLWPEDGAADQLVIEFALGREFMYPLAAGQGVEPFVGLLSAMSDLREGEAAVYQVLFSPLTELWDHETISAVSRPDGKPFFDDGRALQAAALRKVAEPLFGCVLRLAAQSPDFDRVMHLLRHMAAPLLHFADRAGNHLEPLPNEGYDHEEHCRDLLLRRCRRSGMILNLGELTGFAHFPSGAATFPKLRRISGATRAAPSFPVDGHSLLLGLNRHAGAAAEVWLTREQRVRHVHILGSTGTGKSTLLYEMMAQDLDNGRGFALLDPHGDLADRVLGEIPEDRIPDVVVLDPSDEEFCVPFNILSAHSDSEKTLLSSDLVGVFQRLSTSWGDQMNSVLRNAVLAFLESSEGGTLADLRRFLLEPAWRARFLTTVADPDLVYYWTKAFPQLGSNRSVGPIVTRLDTFLSPKPLRRMVSRKENRVDIGEIMDSGKILIARLPQGLMGAENSFLMGGLIVAKLQQMAISRQRRQAEGRRDFFCYIDEAHHFLTPSMREMLSGARKYRLGLVLAHQELRQLERDKEVAGAVSNAGTRIVFRVGDADARALSEGFAHFSAESIQRLQTGEAICRVEGAHHDFNLEISTSEGSGPEAAARRRDEVIDASRRAYGIPRSEIDSPAAAPAPGPSFASPESPPPPAPPEASDDRSPSVDEAAAPSGIPPQAPPYGAQGAPASNCEDSEEVFPSPMQPQAAAEGAPSGRGGPTHRALQRQVAHAAGAAGLKAFPEFDILDGRHRLDVSIEGTGFKVACEIVVTSRLRKEIVTLRACFECGYRSAILVCADPTKLAAASAALADLFHDQDVQCILPVQIQSTLKSLARTAEGIPSSGDEAERFANHDITRSAPKLTAAERRRREHEMLRLIADAIRGESPPEPS